MQANLGSPDACIRDLVSYNPKGSDLTSSMKKYPDASIRATTATYWVPAFAGMTEVRLTRGAVHG